VTVSKVSAVTIGFISLLSLLLSLAAQAQPAAWAPSTDDLINQLKPVAGGPTRGIRIAGRPLATATPTATPEPEPIAQAAGHVAHPQTVTPQRTMAAITNPAPAADPQGTASLTVQFENGSDRLTPEATKTLDTLGQALSNADLAKYKFRIVGHTDSVGSAAYNLALSQRRAAAVVEYLASRFNVDRARLVAEGKGQGEPLVPTPEGVAEPRNRRVQVVNAGA